MRQAGQTSYLICSATHNESKTSETPSTSLQTHTTAGGSQPDREPLNNAAGLLHLSSSFGMREFRTARYRSSVRNWKARAMQWFLKQQKPFLKSFLHSASSRAIWVRGKEGGAFVSFIFSKKTWMQNKSIKAALQNLTSAVQSNWISKIVVKPVYGCDSGQSWGWMLKETS